MAQTVPPQDTRSPKIWQAGSLRIALPAGRTLLSAIVVLLIFGAIAEGAARTLLPAEDMAFPIFAGDDQLGVKVGLLNAYYHEVGKLECVFIGSSMVQRGIDPEIVNSAYQNDMGQPLHCFNFGVHGLNDVGAARIVEFLNRRYRPSMIIFGTSFHEYQDALAFEFDIPWAQNQLGKPSVHGWLEEESIAYRSFLAYGDPLFTGMNTASINDFKARVTRLGYLPDKSVGAIDELPNKTTQANTYQAFADFSPQYAVMRPGFQQLLSPDRQTTLVILEMPIPPVTTAYLPGGKQDYDLFSTLLEEQVRAHQIPFWGTREMTWLPADGWQGYFHLNNTGAYVFSTWVGQRIAAEVKAGTIPDITR
jgi:hypothetical protein